MKQKIGLWTGETGLTFMDRLLIVLVVVGGSLWAVSHFGNALWDYHVLKTLARTVVTEYKDLDPVEVAKRVDYEIGRNRIDNADGKFTLENKEGGGYRVVVELRIPLSITVADYTIAEDKEWVLYYETEK